MFVPTLHLPMVAVVNKSTIATDAEVQAAVDAIQKQVSNDFSPAGWPDALLVFVPAGGAVPAGCWPIYVADTSDQAGDLGYHQTEADGSPAGFCFVATAKKYGVSWTVTLSHEVLELLADPWLFAMAIHQTSDKTSIAYSVEVCDAVEADELGYDIDGIKVSDFVLPAYFQDAPPAGAKFDHMGHLSGPMSLAPGGYAGQFVENVGWTQVTAQTAPTPRQLARKDNGALTRTFRRFNRAS